MESLAHIISHTTISLSFIRKNSMIVIDSVRRVLQIRWPNIIEQLNENVCAFAIWSESTLLVVNFLHAAALYSDVFDHVEYVRRKWVGKKCSYKKNAFCQVEMPSLILFKWILWIPFSKINQSNWLTFSFFSSFFLVSCVYVNHSYRNEINYGGWLWCTTPSSTIGYNEYPTAAASNP